MNRLKITLVAAVALASTVNVFNANKSETLSDIVLANVEALAEDEGTVEYGCGGNPTYLRDKTLKSTLCPPLWLGGTHLKCKSETGVCCDPSGQTDCDSVV